MRLTVALLLLVPAFGLAQTDDIRLVATRNHRAIALPFLRLVPLGKALQKGDRVSDFSWHLANDFRATNNTFEDQETLRLVYRGRWGLKNGMEAFVEVPILNRGGGALDPLIDWWHEFALTYKDPIRNATPFGGSAVRRNGSYDFGSAAGLSDITLGLAKNVTDKWTVRGAVKLPTGNAKKLLGSGGLDIGFNAEYQTKIAKQIHLVAYAGFVLQGKATELANSRSFVHQEGFGIVWKPHKRDAWIGQWQGESSPTEDGETQATHRLITFGYQRTLSDHSFLELMFSEDRDLFSGTWPEAANIGPDFTMGMRFVIRF